MLEPACFFQMLFASQGLYFLKRFCSAMRLDDFDGGQGTIRSIYEAFLRIRYLRFEPEQVEVFLALASVGEGRFKYSERNGRTDWATIIDLRTDKKIKVNISNFRMASSSDEQIDIDAYQILFRHLSRSVHPNVDNIKEHFSMDKGFKIFVEGNPFEGMLLASFVLIMFFVELSEFSYLRQSQRRDARFFAKRIARTLLNFESGALSIFPGEFACLKEKIRSTLVTTSRAC